jgi:type II secretory pathway component PulJ
MIRPRAPRSGFALMMVLVALGILAVLLGSIALQFSINRRNAERRANQLQSLWLARAGLDLAAAKLLANADYRGETTSLVDEGALRIDVRRDNDVYRVTAEATYPAAGLLPVVREASRTFRRVGGERVRLEALAVDAAGAE